MNTKIYASLKSIASFVPNRNVSNKDLEKIVDTSDDWITKRTGIEGRYFAEDNQKSSDLGFEAAKIAIHRANIKATDVDMIICATLSPDYLAMPSTATIISYKLGIENKPAFDISSACSGFIYLLSIAKAYIESGMYDNILIIGAEKTSSVLDFRDRNTCVLFGDGAGAAVIGKTNEIKKAIVDVHISANGKYANLLMTPMDSPFIKMKGNEVFKLAVKTLANDVEEILKKNNIKPKDIDFFIPHQANLRIINAVGNMVDIDSSKIVLTVQKYGNTSAASIPMAIDEIYRERKLKNGDLLLLDAFGGGLTWGSSLLYFNGS
ncbi:beta-ketoacyl-ACP synthase III [Helicobacter sp. MIT 14-3879]|uniref:beta-ketoacyl-ACP synthase III n=1 Tax=Helicobacter sp. MIT 14-3879 TaxID=2040649 RepID=UPI000E1F0C16|nr:beta-ketoacyl-ACP synthase III [Helicobacter sp. MIT 14-3879]RDU65652.1 3-oxoacyl-ACP synthase [Helicobacter sp. MIT 14-3879]